MTRFIAIGRPWGSRLARTAARTRGRAAFLLMPLLVAQAGDWPHWRGPFFNGSSSETNLPIRWSKTENVAWSADLPGPGAATPVVWRDHVFVSTPDLATQTLHACAFDRRTGKSLWSHPVSEGIRKDDMSNYASPSAVTDGERVVFCFGNGALAAFDLTGRELWQRNLQTDYGEFAYQWTPAASPTLHDGRLYLQVLQRNVPVHGRGRTDGPIESFVLALDPADGKTLWKQVRPSEAAAESHEAYSTPIPLLHDGRPELLIVGGDCLTGHDPASGRELWRWGTWNPTRIGHWRLVPSPVAGNGVILACAPKGSPVFAIRAGGTGVLPDSAIAWRTQSEREVSSDVPTPLFYLGDFFVLSDVRRALSRVDPATGAVKWTVETPGRAKYEASPTGADGRLFLLNFAGEVVTVDAASGRILERIAMGEPGDDRTRATIAVAHGQLFIRTNRRLYCIGQGKAPATNSGQGST